MHTKLLIDAIIQQTTVLIAQLSTAAGIRAPLAHVADQVFVELAREIERQGVGRKVVADMFGMALRTYQSRLQRLGESVSARGRTLWEAVYEHIGSNPGARRSQIDERFRNDASDDVAAVLHDLVNSGLVYASGRGESAMYRAVPLDEQHAAADVDALDALSDLVWLTVHRARKIKLSVLCTSLPTRPGDVRIAVERLIARQIVQRDANGEDPELTAVSWVVPVDSTRGWEAAVFDHFSTVASAIVAKVGIGPGSRQSDTIGGGTFTFDVYPGHPFEAQVKALLATTRSGVDALWEQVSAYNRQHPVADDEKHKVSFYFGQNVEEHES